MLKENIIFITGWLNMLLFSIVVIPQFFKTIREKTVKGVSVWVYFLLAVANIDALIYALLINQSPLVVKYLIGLVTALLYVFVFYKHKRLEQNDKIRS